MNILIIILTSLILNACGSSSGGGGDSSGSDDPSAQSNTPWTSYYVDSESSLKACDDGAKGILAYVEDVKLFKACTAQGWQTVNVQGAQGAAGSTGKDGSVVDKTLWSDPNTGKQWKAFGLAQYAPVTDPASWTLICPASQGYYTPYVSEILAATQNGLYVAFLAMGAAYQNSWSYDPVGNGMGGGVGYRRYDTLNIRFTVSAEAASNPGSYPSVTASVICIKR